MEGEGEGARVWREIERKRAGVLKRRERERAFWNERERAGVFQRRGRERV